LLELLLNHHCTRSLYFRSASDSKQFFGETQRRFLLPQPTRIRNRLLSERSSQAPSANAPCCASPSDV